MKIYRKVMVSDRLPKDLKEAFMTDAGSLTGQYMKVYRATYWLEEIELPTEEEVIINSRKDGVLSKLDYLKGANYILNKLK